jgi:glycerol-3-phosphate dehydrogenase
MQAHATSREPRLRPLGGRAFDLLVVGGGITGCGIARDAALRGLSVALVEKNDFASGTSSRSSRLVHGGLRYLEHGHLHLVFESSAERRLLLRLAPHLVRPLEFTWPVYAGARLPRWKLGAGLMLYDALALFRNVGRHRRLGRDAVLEREPMLASAGLRGGASYFDAATNDARLTLANAIGAAEAGAVIANHAAVESLRVERGRVTGARVRDTIAGDVVDVTARAVVNATGPWSDDLRALDEPAGPSVRGSKGVHIAVPRDRLGNRNALTLLSPRDGRVMFALPAGEHAIIDTTDTFTGESPEEVRAANEDVRYLLDSTNAFFPRAQLSERDVVASWAGIRPLVRTGGDTPGAASREHAIATGAHGLISITGGKLTTYRLMAAQVVDVAVKQLGGPASRSTTRTAPLPGGDFDSLDALVASIARETQDVELASHLGRTYGTRWSRVWEEIRAGGGRARVVAELPYTIGELRHAMQREMALTLGDLLIRRAHIAFETRDHGAAAAERVAAIMAAEMGWDAADVSRELKGYAVEAGRIFG